MLITFHWLLVLQTKLLNNLVVYIIEMTCLTSMSRQDLLWESNPNYTNVGGVY